MGILFIIDIYASGGKMEDKVRVKKIFMLQLLWIIIAIAAVVIILLGSSKLRGNNKIGDEMDEELSQKGDNNGNNIEHTADKNVIHANQDNIVANPDNGDSNLENNNIENNQDINNSESNKNNGDDKEMKKKLIAITFDDGPYPNVTNRILDLLEEYNAKATFFVMGNRVNDYSKTLMHIYESGHQIGNHTYSHKQLIKLNKKSIEYEVEYANEMINQIVEVGDTLLRPPYGEHNELVDNTVKVPMIAWSVDSQDWLSRDKDKIFEQVTSTIHENAIILMHDLYPTTADALEELIPYLIQEGYELVTVSELFERNGIELEAGKLYRKGFSLE